MNNLRKNNVIFKKVDKINKKQLNQGLKEVKEQINRKSTVFVDKFEMNKRD